MTAPTLPGLAVPPRSLRPNLNLWGFDLSTRRVSLAIVQARGVDLEPEVGWFSLGIEQHDGGARRLAGLVDPLEQFVRHYAGFAAPGGVLVEQPFGQGKARPHPQSYYVTGVVLTVVARAFPAAAIDVVEPSSWKRDAMGQGYGFAKKPAILAWARDAAGYTGDCPKCHGEGEDCDRGCAAHDEADAIGIATCAAVRWCDRAALR